MAFREYPDNIVVLTCNADSNFVNLGMMKPLQNEQLEVFRVQMFKRGLPHYTRMRINLYTAGGSLIASSRDVLVRDIERAYNDTDNFYGWVCFTFEPRVNFNQSVFIRAELELFNYIYDEASHWIGAVRDGPFIMGYATDLESNLPVCLDLYGGQDV